MIVFTISCFPNDALSSYPNASVLQRSKNPHCRPRWNLLRKISFLKYYLGDAEGSHDCDPKADGEQQNVLTVSDIKIHVDKQGAENTYLVQDVDIIVVVNHVGYPCHRMYIFPKYQLKFAYERRDEMEKIFQLRLASTPDEWNLAYGPYDLDEHRSMWQKFTLVYLLDDGRAVDQHTEYMRQTMTSHQL